MTSVCILLKRLHSCPIEGMDERRVIAIWHLIEVNQFAYDAHEIQIFLSWVFYRRIFLWEYSHHSVASFHFLESGYTYAASHGYWVHCARKQYRVTYAQDGHFSFTIGMHNLV